MTPSQPGEQLHGQALYERQKELLAAPGYLPGPTVVAIGLQMAVNVGAALRLADAAGCARVIFVNDFEYKLKRVRKTALNCIELVDWAVMLPEAFAEEIRALAPLVALELTSRSTSIFETPLPQACTFVMGSERHGIPPDILGQCKQAVHIPMFGVNGSMNVTHALAIALFEWRRQMQRGGES